MKKAIIMGASSGIGHAVAQLLIAEGWQVGLAARRTEPLMALKAMAPERVEVMAIDVTDEASPRLLATLMDRMGKTDLYFHASGIGKQNACLDTTIEQNTIQTNVLGFTRMVDEAFLQMVKQGSGHIAVISSVAGTKGMGRAASYSASKAYQSTYIQALDQLAVGRQLHIRFTDIRPGFVDTPLLTGDHYPMLMQTTTVAKAALRAIFRGQRVCIIDWRYRLLVALWRMIPNRLWRSIRLGRTQ